MLGAGAIAGLVAGLVVGATGFYMLRWGRTLRAADDAGDETAEQGFLATVLGQMSFASRYVIVFCLVVLGYHLVAYSLPGGMLWLRVPPEGLWIMGVVMAIGVGGSLVMDALDRR